MKRIFKSIPALVLAGFFSVEVYESSALANVLVNAPPPAPQHILGDTGYDLYFAASNGPTFTKAGEYIDLTRGYRLINAADSSSLIYLDVSTDQTFSVSGSQVVVVTLGTSAAANDEIPLTGASVVDPTQTNIAPVPCVNTSNCIAGTRNGSSRYLSALYSQGSIMRLSFSLNDLCANSAGVNTGTNAICPLTNNSTYDGTAANGQSVVVSFSIADPSILTNPTGSITPGTSVFQSTVTVYLTDIAPTIAVPASGKIEDYFAPGDQSIFVTGDNFSPLSNGGAPLDSIAIFADRNSTPLITGNGEPGAEIHDYIPASGPNQLASGFANTTNGTDNKYFGAFYALNSAGIFSVGNTVVTPFPTSSSELSGDGYIRAETVNSVLSKSQCFIATAAFHDGGAPPVKMLREFRDQVLAKSALGQDFISTYYHYSPAVARWAWDKPVIRAIALHALAPIEFMAWAILKLTHAEEVSSQPYIDRIKKKLDADNPAQKNGDESYIDSIKKTLSPTPSESESYTEKLKQKIGKSDDEESKGYSEKLKETLPPEDNKEGPIEAAKAGTDHRRTPVKPPITSAFGAKFGVSPGMKVTNTEGVVNFQDMYGNGSAWQPDLVLHYERQIHHSENLGSFGLQADLGVSYAEGYGQYQYAFGSTNTKLSKTKFSFIQLPLTVGGIYRFNLLRLLRPYVGAEIGGMLYTELRSDPNPDRRGVSFIYEAQVGAAFELDFLDKGTSTDGFLSAGIQHTYLIAEFLRMGTFAKQGVLFERNGVYAGFLVEY